MIGKASELIFYTSICAGAAENSLVKNVCWKKEKKNTYLWYIVYGVYCTAQIAHRLFFFCWQSRQRPLRAYCYNVHCEVKPCHLFQNILQQCTWPCTYIFRLFVLLFVLFIRFLLFQHSYLFLQIIWLDKYQLFYSQINNNWAFLIFSLVLNYREMKLFFPCFSCSWVVAYYFCMFVLELM